MVEEAVKVVSWIEDQDTPQLIVSENGKLIRVSLLDTLVLKERVTKDLWGDICWKKGYFQGRCEIREISQNQLALPLTFHQ